MWLIDTNSLELNYFVSCPVGEYAILSHTWEAEEVSFQEFRERKNQSKRGYRKIEQCCRQASSEGLRYAWVDTCCIDKTSSAELSEAINSMFAYYRDARMCYAFLADFMLHGRYESFQDPLDPIARHSDFTCLGCNSAFRKTRWFSRSWTLQELLAPKSLAFYDVDWKFIGTKHDLAEVISTTTRIDVQVLMASHLITTCSVAQRMSWASSRSATRVEDLAYSLLGIFGINLPLLYGEGEEAFTRLQRTIVENSSDESIFAWRDVDPRGDSFFAKYPSQFRDAGAVTNNLTSEIRSPFTLTSRGISIDVKLIPCAMNTYMVPLCCWDRSLSGTADERKLYIFVSPTNLDSTYKRIRLNDLDYGNFHNQLPPLHYTVFGNPIDHRSAYFSNDTALKVREAFMKPEIHFKYRVRTDKSAHYSEEISRVIGYEKTLWELSTIRSGNGSLRRCRFDDNVKLTFFRHNWQSHFLEQHPIDQYARENLVLGGTVTDIDPMTHVRGSILRYVHVGFDQDFLPTCFIALKPGITDGLSSNSSCVRDDDNQPLVRCGGSHIEGFVSRFGLSILWFKYSISVAMTPRSTTISTSQQWDCVLEVVHLRVDARIHVLFYFLDQSATYCSHLWHASRRVRHFRLTVIVLLIALLTAPSPSLEHIRLTKSTSVWSTPLLIVVLLDLLFWQLARIGSFLPLFAWRFIHYVYWAIKAFMVFLKPSRAREYSSSRLLQNVSSRPVRIADLFL